ncbi:hypothetical protein LX64_04151 [Chitinophaga skermanii]|uniref:Uncharacterized protein n=1 Tax=Chitinophaga skermanii TaxID=331697 RepID=A0A327Q930_9BACT|nr:hypothetical protein [Chitinophaga skermanii]RAJ00445.1 hypothetical protein LX64_04151 [Chitinophaga skermanii]
MDNRGVIKFSDRILSKLGIQEQNIVKALGSEKLGDLDLSNNTVLENTHSKLIDAMTMAYSIAGQKADASQLAIQCGELIERILEEVPRLTVDEVKIALRNGVYDSYGDYFGLNLKTFMFFIRSYIRSEMRSKAIADYKHHLNLILPKEEISLDEKNEESNEQMISFLREKYRAGTLDFDFIPTYIVDYLIRANKITAPLDLEKAKTYYYTSYREPFSIIKINISGKELEGKIVAIAKQYLLLEYIKKLDH